LQASLQGVTGNYRKIVVLLDDADSLDDATRAGGCHGGRKTAEPRVRSQA